MQGLGVGTTMSVGGGMGDAAADITYSTKPNNLLVITEQEQLQQPLIIILE